jgi:hypothetical protein
LPVAAIAIAGLFFLAQFIGPLFAHSPPPLAAPPPGMVRATNDEWTDLGLATAQTIAFTPVDQTDGVATRSVGVPEQGVVFEGDEARVWVARADHLLQRREIRTGQTMGGMVQVLSGLSAGERVVTNGALFIDRASRVD